MSGLREVPESDLPPFIKIDVQLEQDDITFVVIPLDAAGRHQFQVMLDDDELRSWRTAGALSDSEWNVIGSMYYVGGSEKVRIRTHPRVVESGYISPMRIQLRYQDDVSATAVNDLRCANFYGSRLVVDATSTAERMVLIPSSDCKVCGNVLLLGELEWRMCDSCVKVCEHDYVEGHGRSDGRLVQMTFCSKCGRPDPEWKPAHAVVSVISSL